VAKQNVSCLVAHPLPGVGNVKLAEKDRVIVRQVAALTAERQDAKGEGDRALQGAALLCPDLEIREFALDVREQAVGARHDVGSDSSVHALALSLSRSGARALSGL
jgi:hypothetical protein